MRKGLTEQVTGGYMGWTGKESAAVKVMKDAGWSVMNHDDKICYRAQKTGTGGAVGIALADGWWRKVQQKMVDGKPVITGYWNQATGDHKGAAWGDTLEGLECLRSEKGWKETTAREYTKGLPKGVSVTFENNQVDMRIVNLYDDLESRYKSALDYLASMAGDIIRYEPKLENPTERNRREAMRNRLKRSFQPVEYEHNIIFLGQVGRDMMRELRAAAEKDSKMHLEENTVYLEGWKKTAKQKRRVKYYDIGARDAAVGGEAGEIFKLEVTLLKEYFKGAGLAVEDLKEQPEIQEVVRKELAEKVNGVLCLLETGGDAMKGIQFELGLSGRENTYQVAGAILNKKKTLTERMDAVERLAQDTARRVDALETKVRSGK